MTDVYVVTEGEYEDEFPVAVFTELKFAMGHYPVTMEWSGDEDGSGPWTAWGKVEPKDRWNTAVRITTIPLNPGLDTDAGILDAGREVELEE